ncbi:MAG: hypothetical protein EPN84_11015 [Legionella sp.]|nr:MAG: hypothetical protein EPN84_11015 [Legionella sp.]
MSQDPFSALRHSLQPLFHFEAMRNGKYTFAEIQKLKEATDNYQPEDTASFIKLLQALKGALPYLEKWKVDFSDIRTNMEILAKDQNLSINWSIFLRHPKVSHKFQFNAQNKAQSRELELIPWIALKTAKPFAELSQVELIEFLIKNCDTPGFNNRLDQHLKNTDPDFLLRLILDSVSTFSQICKSNLSLQLKDEQIAKAIIYHAETWIKPHINPLIQVEQFVNTLNEHLGTGRSVGGLLRNKEAKAILDKSKYFQIYQSEEYANRRAPHPRSPSPGSGG